MKIIAAIMDVAILRFYRRERIWITKRKIKKFFVYDPSKVTGWDLRKRRGDVRKP